jgi:general secretion pathway protein D
MVEDGKRLIAQGQTEDGLTLLEKASREDPRNPEIRAQWMRERELALIRLLEAAERERALGNLKEAEAAYARILRMDANQVRAKAGMSALQSDVRLQQLLVQAEQLFGKGEVAAADTRVRAILSENPAMAGAKTLQRRIIDRLKTAARAAATAPRPAFAKPISLDFRDAPIRSVFEMISRNAGINFVFDKDVPANIRVTIFVRNSSIEDAVKLLLVTNQLERKMINDNSVLIYPNTPAKLKEYQELVVRSFYLGNADVKQTQLMIKNLIRTRDMFIDEKLNLLIIRDTPEAVRMAEKLIAAHDLAEPEVMLDVEVLEVKRSKLQELGIQYPNQFTVLNIVPAPSTVTTTGGVVVQSTNATTTTSQLTLESLRGRPAAGQVAVSPSPSLNLRSDSSDVNLLANPRIRVKNREKAKIHIGDRVPVITTTSTANVGVSQSVTYLDIGLKLDVEPNVLLDDEVTMRIGLEVSNIVREITNNSGVLTYQVGTRAANTVLRLKNGETQVLAGLISDEDRRGSNGIPGLADLPLIGKLFSNNRTEAAKTEIMLLITPRVLRNVARPEFYATEYPGGTDAAAGVAPLRLNATPAGALSIPPSGAAPAVKPPAAKPAAGANPAVATSEVVATAPQTGSPPPTAIRPSISAASQVTLGNEFAVSVAFPVAVSRAEFEMVYDASLMVNAGDAAASGRLTVRLDNPGNQSSANTITVPFRVIARNPGEAGLRIENVVVEVQGGAQPSVIPPAPLQIRLTP